MGSGGAGEGLGCLGYNALPVVDVAVALGELCNFIHKMAACIVLVVVDFVGGVGVHHHEMAPTDHRRRM